MTHIEDIVLETIGVLTAPYQSNTHLCPYHPDDKVRTTIHSLLRMESCRVNRTGILSPCYPSKGYKECRNNPCPFVIGHSIYLWVGYSRKALHAGEAGGCGCSFKHSKRDIDEIRQRVADILEQKFGLYSVIVSPPLHALARIQMFHQRVVQVMLARGAPVEMTFTYNVVTMKPEGAMLFKSDDSIFEHISNEEEEEYEEVEEIREEDNTKKFPAIAEVYTSRVEEEPPRKKSPKTRNELPYQVSGI